jgi:hypothetical protein
MRTAAEPIGSCGAPQRRAPQLPGLAMVLDLGEENRRLRDESDGPG